MDLESICLEALTWVLTNLPGWAASAVLAFCGAGAAWLAGKLVGIAGQLVKAAAMLGGKGVAWTATKAAWRTGLADWWLKEGKAARRDREMTEIRDGLAFLRKEWQGSRVQQ